MRNRDQYEPIHHDDDDPEPVRPGWRQRRKAKRAAQRDERQANFERHNARRKANPNVSPWPILVIVVLFLAAGVLGPRLLGNDQEDTVSEEPPATATAEPTTTPTASPVGQSTPSGDYLGVGPQAEQTPAPASPNPIDIPAYQTPTVDRDDPESVAKAWAYVYHSIPVEGATDFPDAADYTAPELRTFMRSTLNAPGAPLAGKKPTIMRSVKFSEDKEALRDTPTRWSRNADVRVDAADGTRLTIRYAITLYITDAGWTVSQAEQTYYTGAQ